MRLVALLLIVPVPFVLDQIGKPACVQASAGSIYNWALVLCLVVLLMLGRESTGYAARPANPVK